MLIAATLVIPTIIIEEAGPGEPLETLAVALNYAVWTAFLAEAMVMTTVGYGDLSPHTPEGKIVAVIVMLVGIGFIALLTGAIAQAFIRPRAVRLGDTSGDETMTENDLLIEFRDLSARMRELERALEVRLSVKSSN
jgi:voltage-gated potassium channel Kch